jgi:hypothetical protein
MSDIKDKLKNIIINTQQEEGLYYIEEETEIIDNKIVMVFRGEPEEIEDNINTVDNVHVCTITFDDSNRC